jgi:hypothetical protein
VRVGRVARPHLGKELPWTSPPANRQNRTRRRSRHRSERSKSSPPAG